NSRSDLFMNSWFARHNCLAIGYRPNEWMAEPVSGPSVFTIRRPVVGRKNAKSRAAFMRQGPDQNRNLSVHVAQRRGVALHCVRPRVGNIEIIRLMQGGHVNEQERGAFRLSAQSLFRKFKLVAGGIAIGHTKS